MSKNELQIVNAKDVFTQDIVKQVALKYSSANEIQVKMFLVWCANMRMNPLAGDADLVVVGNRWFPQIRIDGFRKIANRTGLYLGQTPQEWCGEDGQWKDVWLGPGNPMAARVGVYRKGNTNPIYGVASWNDFGKGKGANWSKMPAHMLSKTAESLAIRKAFPEQFAGAYTEYEDVKQDNPEQQSKLAAINSEFEEDRGEKKESSPDTPVEEVEAEVVGGVPDQSLRSDVGEHVIDFACRFVNKRIKDIPKAQALDYMRIIEGSDSPQHAELLKKMKIYFS